MLQARACLVVCAGLFLLALLLPSLAAAAWPTDPTVNLPICTAAANQHYPAIVSDGAGGAIISWQDGRNGVDYDLYAQRISAAGTVLWTANGVALSTATGAQQNSAIVSDGEAPTGTGSGAIVTWMDRRSGTWDIYAQRVNAMGAIQWWADGLAACSATGDQQYPTITSDGAHGAIVAWQDSRTGTNDIYAQRILVGGAVQWTAGGVALCTAAGSQQNPTIVSDGEGGAIVTWCDYRSGSKPDIYAQRISADGTVRWSADGVPICADAYEQRPPVIVSDGAGGAIIAWMDYRSSNFDIYAQRILPGGTVQWTANGVAVCTAPDWQQAPAIASDGGGGATITWSDKRSGTDFDIYAQAISAAGATRWEANGVALCTATGAQGVPTIAANAAGGAIVTWSDYRGGGSNIDIYAQRISAAGATQWTANGLALCAATGNQEYPVITTDGAHGAIVTWYDSRGGLTDIYAQRVQANGQLGGDATDVPGEVSAGFALDPVRPNPSRGGALTVRFTLPGDAAAALELLDVAGRRMAAREVGSLGAGQHTLDLGEGCRCAPGLYLVRLRQGTNMRVSRVVVLQ
jgi:hypothetical protein